MTIEIPSKKAVFESLRAKGGKKMTAQQFKAQNAFWQDKYYSYALHKTNGGALYLYRIEGLDVNERSLDTMHVFRLDGVDLEKLFENIKAVQNDN